MNFNAVLSVSNISDESDLGVEPVTLAEVKNYLRLEGFIDTDESTSDDLSDFEFDDILIEDVIMPGARQMMERMTGLSLIPKTLEAIITNLCSMIEIPQGPVREVTELSDEGGTEIVSYTLIGNKFLKSPTYANMTITYEAGYITLPAAIKLDLLRIIAYMYENRGDDASIDSFTAQIASKYSRNSPIS